MLRKYILDESYIVKEVLIQLDSRLMYEKWLITSLDWQVQKLRWREILMVKVMWGRHDEQEATWELKLNIWEKYLNYLVKNMYNKYLAKDIIYNYYFILLNLVTLFRI